MNFSQAKNVKIENYLSLSGIKPVRIYGNYFWYKSPLRNNDNEPSFKVNTLNNLWYDLGTGNGGNIVDLVSLMNNCNVSNALRILASNNINLFSFQSSEIKNNTRKIKISKVQSLQNPALQNYLKSRKIKLEIIYKYVLEAYYTIKDKQYFAVAFGNDKGGFELRNKYFKGSSNPKAITTIKGLKSNNLNIFEGFIDFLSALTFFDTLTPNFDTIVLNSTTQINSIISVLSNYDSINLFLDNDIAGKNAIEKIKKHQITIKNRSSQFYPEHKDFNDFLINAIK